MAGRLSTLLAGDASRDPPTPRSCSLRAAHPKNSILRTAPSAILLLLLLLLSSSLVLFIAPVSAGPEPVPLVAPVVNSFGMRRDANGDFDCPPGEPFVNDTQIDVSTSEIFCIFADVSDPDGWASVNYANVSAYYDSGSEASVYNQTLGANRNFLLNYTNLSTSSFAMRWPTTDEMTFLGGVDQIITGTNHELRWRMRFGAAVRWAPCTLGGAAPCGLPPVASIHSWNATLRVRDATAAVATANMEFGTFKLTTLSVANSPSGSGFPGGPEFRLGAANPQRVTFSSNAPYRLNVSICDLTTSGVCGAATPTIPREYIRVEGELVKLNQNFRIAFPTTTGPLILNGTQSCFNEFRNGTGTSDAAVSWFARIPLGTLAGSYSSTINYSVAHALAPDVCLQLTPDPPLFMYAPLVTDLTASSFRVSWVANRPVAGTLEVSTSSTFASILCTPVDASTFLASGAVMISTTAACTGASALSPTTTYYWRVRMVDALGRTNYYPLQSPYPSTTTKSSVAVGFGNPAYIIGPYRDIDGGESCNYTDDRQVYFLAYLNHSGAGPLVGRGSAGPTGCTQGWARAGWLINIASNNLRDDTPLGAPHALACGESVNLWTVGFNNTFLHENRTTNTLPTGGCPPLPGSIAIAVKTRPNASTGFPQYLTTPVVTDLTATSLRLSWVADKPVYATLHLSLLADFSTFYCTQMDASNLLTSGGSLIETLAPSCVLGSGTTYYWRAHMMDAEGRVTYYPSSGAYASNTTKTNLDPGDVNNPTLLTAPFRDIDGSTLCNAPDDRQQFFLVYVNHTGAERLGWRSTSGGNMGCGQPSKANWLTTIPLSNLRNNNVAGTPHACAVDDSTTPTTIWIVGYNNTKLHSNNTGTFTYSCPAGSISRVLRTSPPNTGGPLFMYSPLSSDLTTAAFSVSWVASAPVTGAISLSTSSTFATIFCTSLDTSTFLTSGAVLVSTAPGCTLGSPATYYWRAHMMDSVGRTARYPPGGAYPSNTTKTDATPGAGTNPVVALGPYRDPNLDNACTQVDERQPYFIAYLNHTGAERLAARGAGSNPGCGGGAVSGWIVTFSTDNLRNNNAAGAPHALAAAESLTFTLRGFHLSVYRAASLSVTWDGAEDPIVRFVESSPTLLFEERHERAFFSGEEQAATSAGWTPGKRPAATSRGVGTPKSRRLTAGA